MNNDLISRKAAKVEIRSWAVRINDPANLSTEDTMTVNYLGDACEEIISRLDGLKVFARERKSE